MQQSDPLRGRSQKPRPYGSFTSGELILSIGRMDFNRRFFDLMHREFDVAQAIVFRKVYATPAVETLMAESPGEHDVIHVPQLSVGSCPAGTWLRQICG